MVEYGDWTPEKGDRFIRPAGHEYAGELPAAPACPSSVPLLCSTLHLDLAIERMDPVISRFPSLVSARHARATAYHRKWLNTAPVQTQQLRSSLYTYTARFVPWLTQGAEIGDALALHRARRDYAAILDREIIPGTMANLALLDAYAGNPAQAKRRALEAARLAPADPGVLNNLGVIHFLLGDRPAAADLFARAARFTAACLDPVTAFNRAKSTSLLGGAGARELLERYLDMDPGSDWRREALSLLGRPGEVEGRSSRRPPQVLPGLSLGAQLGDVEQRYGSPSRLVNWRDLAVISYDHLGLELTLTNARGVILIDLRRPGLGSIEDVGVGESVWAVQSRWGWPAERGEGYLVYWRGEWGVGIEHDDRDRITMLSLGCRE
jgi:tetratricopeptide (TPR) repeat protein